MSTVVCSAQTRAMGWNALQRQNKCLSAPQIEPGTESAPLSRDKAVETADATQDVRFQLTAGACYGDGASAVRSPSVSLRLPHGYLSRRVVFYRTEASAGRFDEAYVHVQAPSSRHGSFRGPSTASATLHFAKTWITMVWVLPCTPEVHIAFKFGGKTYPRRGHGTSAFGNRTIQRTFGSVSISMHLNSNLFTLTRSTNPTLFDSGLVGMRGVP